MSFAAAHWLWLALPLTAVALLRWRERRVTWDALGLIFLVVALAAPRYAPLATRGTSVPACRIVLDLSRSMLAADAEPSRFAQALATISARLAREEGRRFGVIAFAGEAWTVAPPTADHAALRELLAELSPLRVANAGSDLSAGLALAVRSLQPHEELWLLGDGEWEGGDPAPLVAQLRAAGHRIEATAFGGNLAVALPPDEEPLPAGTVEWTQAQPERVAALASEPPPSGVKAAPTKERWVTLCALLSFLLALLAHRWGGRDP